MIWHRIPKTILVSSTTFDIGVYDAAAHFKTGNVATLEIFDEIGIERGSFTILGCHDDNQKRIENSQRKSSDIYRGRRSELRGSKKRKKDKDEVKEGKTYGAGQFTFSKKKKGS